MKVISIVAFMACIVYTEGDLMAMKLTRFLGTIVILLLMIAALGIFLAPRLGWRVDAVFSGSMEPEFKAGDVVITQPIQTTKIKEGDIITYLSPHNNEMTSHRVMAVEDGPAPGFHTKGDANEDADPYLVPAKNIVGRVCFSLPYFGHVTAFIKTPKGLLLTLFLPGSIIVILELINIWRVVYGHDKRKKYRFAMVYGHEGRDIYQQEPPNDREGVNKYGQAPVYGHKDKSEYWPMPAYYYEDGREYRQMPLSGRERMKECRQEPGYDNKGGKKNKKAAVYSQVKKRKYRNGFEKKYAKFLARSRELDHSFNNR